MDHPDLERVYSAKTDDELIALAAQRRSLEPDAQTVLWTELRRRKLTDSRLLRPGAAYKTPSQNLSFNLPAKAGAVVIYARKVDEPIGNQSCTQRGDRRHCQQAGQDQLGSFGERERLSASAQSSRVFQLDEVGSKILFSGVCRR